MKITYTAPNRPYDYPYVTAMCKAGHLHAFVSGFTRLSPRSPIPQIGDKLKRHDFFQTLYLGGSKLKVNASINSWLQRLSDSRLDKVSYRWARDSDVFIFHRTQGYDTTKRIRKDKIPVTCVMHEVNSHVEFAHELMLHEYNLLGLKKKFEGYNDYFLRLKTYELADCILCPSEFVRQSFLLKGFSPSRLIKVNFGFPEIEPFEINIEKEKNETFRLLYVGQLNYRKGLRYAIEAFRGLNHPKKEFVLVGPVTEITGLERTKIPDNVIFTGPLKGDALREQYKRANVFVLPSLEEGLALVQGEALASGLPLLITSNTGGEDIITDGVEGFIVPPGDSNALLSRLQQMVDVKYMLSEMSIAALNTAKKIGSWDLAVENLVAQLKQKLKT